MKLDATFAKSDQQFGIKFKENEQSFIVGFGEAERAFCIEMEETERSFGVSFRKEERSMDVSFGENLVVEHITGGAFDGPYEVTPKVDAQVLPTKQKYMKKDLTVLSVPYYEADNSKGTTIFIASEV